MHHILLPFLFCGRLALVDCSSVSWKIGTEIYGKCIAQLKQLTHWCEPTFIVKSRIIWSSYPPKRVIQKEGQSVKCGLLYLALSVCSRSAVFVILTVGLTKISKQRKSPHIHKARTSLRFAIFSLVCLNGPPVWFRLKYLNTYQMDWRQIWSKPTDSTDSIHFSIGRSKLSLIQWSTSTSTRWIGTQSGAHVLFPPTEWNVIHLVFGPSAGHIFLFV